MEPNRISTKLATLVFLIADAITHYIVGEEVGKENESGDEARMRDEAVRRDMEARWAMGLSI